MAPEQKPELCDFCWEKGDRCGSLDSGTKIYSACRVCLRKALEEAELPRQGDPYPPNWVTFSIPTDKYDEHGIPQALRDYVASDGNGAVSKDCMGAGKHPKHGFFACAWLHDEGTVFWGWWKDLEPTLERGHP